MYKRICIILQHTVWVLNVPHQPTCVILSLQLIVGCDRNSKQSGQLKVFGHGKYFLKRMSRDLHIFPFLFVLLPHHEVNCSIRCLHPGLLLGYRPRTMGPIDHGPRPPKVEPKKTFGSPLGCYSSDIFYSSRKLTSIGLQKKNTLRELGRGIEVWGAPLGINRM